MFKYLILLILASTFSAQAATFELNWENLKAFLNEKDLPKLKEIETNFLEAEVGKMSFHDSLGFETFVGGNYSETRERAILNFAPIFSPIRQYQVGVRKNFQYGLSAEASISNDNRSGASNMGTEFKDINTTIYALDLKLDLWKNLFGKLTKRELENAEINLKAAQLKKEISVKALELTLKRLYFSLVANAEKLKIAQGLFETATKQARDAQERFKFSVADRAEVVGYESQVAQRKGSILYLEFEREKLLQQLKNLVPDLSSKEIQLLSYNLEDVISGVFECTQLINSQNQVPYDYTDYDELTKKLKSLQSNEVTMAKTYSDIDLKLSTKFKKTGVGSEEKESNYFEGSYSDSLDDMNENNRSGMDIGMVLTIPFGKGSTEDTKTILAKNKFSYQIDDFNNSLVSSHGQIVKSIKLLYDVIEIQKVNSKKLKERLLIMQKKYDQARVPVSALIQDQDALLSSDLTIVDTELTILNTLFDYFTIFNKTPCSLNRI
jgi:outer membrane protein TolC